MHDIQEGLRWIIDFLRIDIWRIRLEDLPFGKSFLIKQLRIIILSFRGFDEDKCLLRASSLTFYTLLSIPSIFAMVFGIAKGFGFEKMLERELFNNFPGQDEVLTQIINFSNSLLDNTRGGVIAGIGLAVLFWSVLKVLGHIEAAFNRIWEIKESRSWGRKISDYLSIMLISPLFVIVSGSTTVFIRTQVTQITQSVDLFVVISPIITSMLKLIPYVLIWILFTFIYLIMPNTKVKFKSGLLGGVVAGTLYQLAQLVYIGFQIGVAKYNAIYGSFAALPLFLIWIQVSWWIVLFGAELSFANQNVDTYEYEPDCLEISPTFKKLLTLQIAHLLVHNFSNGANPLTDSQISNKLKIPIRLVHNILFDLVQSGLVSETKTKEYKQFGYQPARDINVLTINYILKTLEQKGSNNIPVAKTETLTALLGALQQFNSTIENSPENRLLKDI